MPKPPTDHERIGVHHPQVVEFRWICVHAWIQIPQQVRFAGRAGYPAGAVKSTISFDELPDDTRHLLRPIMPGWSAHRLCLNSRRFPAAFEWVVTRAVRS